MKQSQVSPEAAAGIRSVEQLYRYLGIGKYSIIVLCACVYNSLFTGTLTLGHNFFSAAMPFTCNVNASVIGSFDDCTATHDECSVNCSLSGIAPCTSWTFDTSEFTETIVSRFALVCDSRHLATLPTTLYFVGFLVGSTAFGIVSDKFGRVTSLSVACVQLMVCAACSGLSPALWVYATLQLLAGAGCGGVLGQNFTINVESVHSGRRKAWAMIQGFGWSTGSALCAVVSLVGVRSFSLLLLILTCLGFVSLAFAYACGESGRWLLQAGKEDRSEAFAKRAARLNGVTLPADFSARQLAAETVAAGKNRKTESAWLLLATPGMRRVTIATWVVFGMSSMVFYGISLGVGSLGGSIFLNLVLASAAEVPSQIIGLVLRVGRRPLLLFCFVNSALALAATAVLFNFDHLVSARVACAMYGKVWISLGFNMAFLYAGEAFPTTLRSAGVGTASTMARAGAITSTAIALLSSIHVSLPFCVFGAAPIVAATMLFFMPETVGGRLPENSMEGERFANWEKLSDEIVINE